MVIAVIGAGASGMAAAIATAEDPNNKTVIFERQPRVGKKLSVTGNGRCNLSNINAAKGGYHGNDADFSKYALSRFSPENTLEWFRSLGLFTMTESSGRVYPYSEQANAVVDVLRFALAKPNIRTVTGCEIQRIRKTKDGFVLEYSGKSFKCDRVIAACGGIAGSKAGGTLAGYRLLRSLGHTSTQLRPALVQIKTKWSGVSALKGVRANCRASVFYNGRELISSSGEIQFTDYGISGPVIFEISRDVCVSSGSWECRLDLIPQLQKEELFTELMRRKQTELTSDDLLTGILHNRLGRVICKEAGIRGGVPVRDIPDYQLERLSGTVKEFGIELLQPMGMENAQVTAGGILTEEIDRKTMESKLVKGLYICGELIDIDGDCGGYNLQWAWSSGRLAGESAGEIRK